MLQRCSDGRLCPRVVAKAVASCYRPNHHIFYDDRVKDVADSIPKWATLPEVCTRAHL